MAAPGAETTYRHRAELTSAVRRVNAVVLIATGALLIMSSTAASALPKITQPARSGPCPSANGPAACKRPFSRSSPFNTRVPAHPKLVSNSAQIVHRIVRQGPPAAYYAGSAGTPNDWSHPVYFATASDPRYRIDQTGWVNRDIEGQRIHVPPRAKPAGGPDHTFTVVQPNGWEYNFYRARAPTRSTRTLSARFGKREWWAGDGLGTSRPPYRGGITAAGFSNEAGVIRLRELKAGAINHALFMEVNGWHGRVWPAAKLRGTTGRVASASAPALGQHFWLHMSGADIRGLAVPRWQKVILHAMAKYGMYVGDYGSAPWALQFESGDNYTSFGYPDPWLTYARSLSIPGFFSTTIGRTLYPFNFGKAVDWGRRLKVLKPRQHHHHRRHRHRHHHRGQGTSIR